MEYNTNKYLLLVPLDYTTKFYTLFLPKKYFIIPAVPYLLYFKLKGVQAGEFSSHGFSLFLHHKGEFRAKIIFFLQL
jgi:hypothetical protein